VPAASARSMQQGIDDEDERRDKDYLLRHPLMLIVIVLGRQ
jgi:hypothetical protein